MTIRCRRSSHFGISLRAREFAYWLFPMPVKPSVYPDKLTRRVASGWPIILFTYSGIDIQAQSSRRGSFKSV